MSPGAADGGRNCRDLGPGFVCLARGRQLDSGFLLSMLLAVYVAKSATGSPGTALSRGIKTSAQSVCPADNETPVLIAQNLEALLA